MLWVMGILTPYLVPSLNPRLVPSLMSSSTPSSVPSEEPSLMSGVMLSSSTSSEPTSSTASMPSSILSSILVPCIMLSKEPTCKMFELDLQPDNYPMDINGNSKICVLGISFSKKKSVILARLFLLIMITTSRHTTSFMCRWQRTIPVFTQLT